MFFEEVYVPWEDLRIKEDVIVRKETLGEEKSAHLVMSVAIKNKETLSTSSCRIPFLII